MLFSPRIREFVLVFPDALHQQFAEDEVADDEDDAHEGDALDAGAVAEEEDVGTDLEMVYE